MLRGQSGAAVSPLQASNQPPVRSPGFPERRHLLGRLCPRRQGRQQAASRRARRQVPDARRLRGKATRAPSRQSGRTRFQRRIHGRRMIFQIVRRRGFGMALRSRFRSRTSSSEARWLRPPHPRGQSNHAVHPNAPGWHDRPPTTSSEAIGSERHWSGCADLNCLASGGSLLHAHGTQKAQDHGLPDRSFQRSASCCERSRKTRCPGMAREAPGHVSRNRQSHYPDTLFARRTRPSEIPRKRSPRSPAQHSALDLPRGPSQKRLASKSMASSRVSRIP